METRQDLKDTEGYDWLESTELAIDERKFYYFQSDWLRAVVFQLNLKYLHVKITNLLDVVV